MSCSLNISPFNNANIEFISMICIGCDICVFVVPLDIILRIKYCILGFKFTSMWTLCASANTQIILSVFLSFPCFLLVKVGLFLVVK